MIIRQCRTMLCNARSALMMAALLCVAVSSDTNGVLNDSLGNTTSSSNTTINGDSDINIGNNSSSNNTNDTTTTQNNGGPQNSPAFQFVAFLAWYIFLVLCCVIPACCAFRRRRYMDEERLRQQHANIQRLQQSNLFLWTQSQHAAMSSEAAVALRKTMLSEALASTSMVVEPDHLVKALALGLEEVVLNDGNDLGDDDGNKASEAAATMSVASALHPPDTDNTAVRFPDLERGLGDPDPDDVESNRLLLQLPNGRTVGSMCAICLSQYEVGDNVTWSMHCPHAFHSDCIISWLSKKQHCPVCRQDFCNVLPISVQDTEDQQRQLSLAFGGTLPLSSLFSVEPSGRLVAISLGSNENNYHHYHHHSNTIASSRHNAGQYVGPRGRWTPPWQGTWTANAERPAQASNINNAQPVRVHLPSLSNPRMFIAETQHPELARSEEPIPSVPVDVASDVSSDLQSIPDNGGSPERIDDSSR